MDAVTRTQVSVDCSREPHMGPNILLQRSADRLVHYEPELGQQPLEMAFVPRDTENESPVGLHPQSYGGVRVKLPTGEVAEGNESEILIRRPNKCPITLK